MDADRLPTLAFLVLLRHGAAVSGTGCSPCVESAGQLNLFALAGSIPARSFPCKRALHRLPFLACFSLGAIDMEPTFYNASNNIIAVGLRGAGLDLGCPGFSRG